jgi:ATP-dependent RNA helicase DDX54/DBP10
MVNILIFYQSYCNFRDRKSKKFVAAEQNQVKKIRTEDGTLLPASYRSGRYNSWVEKQKMSFAQDDDDNMGEIRVGAKGAKRQKWKKSKNTGMKSFKKSRFIK